jgi:hypothetical protein
MGGIETRGKPAVDSSEDLASFIGTISIVQQARGAGCRARLNAFTRIFSVSADRFVEVALDQFANGPCLRSNSPLPVNAFLAQIH